MQPSAHRRRALLHQFRLMNFSRFNHSCSPLALSHTPHEYLNLNNKAPHAHRAARHRKGIAAAQTKVCDHIIYYVRNHDNFLYLDDRTIIEDHEDSDREQDQADEHEEETEAAGGYDSDIYVRVRTLHLYYILFLYLKPSSLVLLPHGIPKRFLSKLRVV